jgi:hypothetical protein
MTDKPLIRFILAFCVVSVLTFTAGLVWSLRVGDAIQLALWVGIVSGVMSAFGKRIMNSILHFLFSSWP